MQITRGIDRTVGALVKDLEGLSTEVDSNDDLCNVATVSAGGNELVGQLIRDAMEKVGRKGVITLEESRTAEDNLVVVEGMQFERGFVSPYFVTDPERMVAEFENCKLLLVDKKITSARDLVGILEEAIRGGWPLMIMAEDIEQEPLATLVVNKLRGQLKVVAIKAPGFGDRKSQYLEDIAIMTGATVVKEELGLDVSTVGPEVLGQAAKVTLSKENCVIVGDGSTQGEVEARVKQIKVLLEEAEAEYEREKLSERIAKLSGGVAIVQVGAQTETELKEKKLRVEDALNATKAAVEEGIVIGGGCTLLKLAACVDAILPTLDNDEQRVGGEIVKKALSYPLKLVASNAGTNGSVVMQKVLESSDANHGFNAATGEYGDLMQEGIIDPTKVIRCALENSASVARTFLTSDVVVTEIPSEDGAEADAGGMGGY